jgi:fused signal recognition particle receptor
MRSLALTAATLAAALSAAVLAATGPATGAPAAVTSPPFTECPAVGASPSCGVLVVLNADGSTSLNVDPGSATPFDGSDGITVGVLNNSGRTISSVSLTSNLGLFGFDGGGMCSGTFPPPTPTGCPFDSNVSDTGSDFAGPGITFSGISGTPATSGVVAFAASCSGGLSCTPTPGGLTSGNTAFLSLESAPAGASFSFPKAAPTLTNRASRGTAGGSVSASATLAGGASATGAIAFNLYANTTCTGTPVASASAGVTGNGTYTSGNLPVAAAGTHTWVVSYSGDANNNGAESPCGTLAVTVGKAKATISRPSAPVAGGRLVDSATLAGGAAPSGTITFRLWANAACTGTPVAAAVAPVTGDGTYRAGNLPASGPGTYSLVASYSGDANNDGSTTPCGAQTIALSAASGLAASGVSATPSSGPARPASSAGTQAAPRALPGGRTATSAPLLLIFLLASALLVAGTVGFALMRARGPVLVGAPPRAGFGSAALLGDSLTRSREALGEHLAAIGARPRLDDEAWEAVEDALIRADVGARATGALLEGLRRQKLTPEGVGEALRRQLTVILHRPDRTLQVVEGAASVWLVAGFNGTARATAGKLARLLGDQGRGVVLTGVATVPDHAGDEARMLTERDRVHAISRTAAADPGGAISDAIALTQREGIDVVVADAGGGQDPSAEVTEELREIRRIVAERQAIVSEALLVVDATTGQNGIARARGLSEAVQPTGAVLTNLDATPRGGIVLAVEEELDIPIKVVGVGGAAGDLAVFDPKAFVEGLIGITEATSPAGGRRRAGHDVGGATEDS